MHGVICCAFAVVQVLLAQGECRLAPCASKAGRVAGYADAHGGTGTGRRLACVLRGARGE